MSERKRDIGESFTSSTDVDKIMEGPEHKGSRGKPNKLLTESEKAEKRRLKKKLKIQKKIKKLEVRIRHAISRKDPVVEKQTIKELEALCARTNETHFLDLKANADENVEKEGQKERLKEKFSVKNALLEIANKLFQSFSDEQVDDKARDNGTSDRIAKTTNNITSSKEHQTNCAVKLMRNMTKGNVNLDMFDDRNALLGYTRQKFFERAMLLNSSMEKLRPMRHKGEMKNNDSTCGLTQEQREIQKRMWNRIQGGPILNSCSIGCGPGGDACGLIIFLNKLHDEKSSSTDEGVGLNRILMLDWSIEKWESAVLLPLVSIIKSTDLIKQNNEQTDVFDTSFCDVTKPYCDKSNDQARTLIDVASCDIFLTSYLLSETNGKWDSFFSGLIHAAKQESLFYFAEPTPWQLHRLVDQFSASLEFLWVDSSMYYPSLQSLDRRASAAVLLAIKK